MSQYQKLNNASSNSLSSTGTTVGAVNLDMLPINLGAVPGCYIVESKAIGFESTTPAGTGYNLICVVKTDGATATMTAGEDYYNSEDVSLAAADAHFVAVGNTIVTRVTGAAGFTIKWAVTSTYTKVN